MDTVLAWVRYAESSQEGLWETRDSHPLLFVPSDTLGGEAIDPPFYDPYAFCVSGDTVFLADQGAFEIVALDTSGAVLWRAGEQGEGPGHFSRMSTVAVSSEHVLAMNPLLGRVEVFDRSGRFLRSHEVSLPQDAASMSDGMFLVASMQQPGGHLHLLDPDSGIVESFGELPVSEDYDNVSMMDMMRLCVGPGDTIALFNRYEGRLAVYSPEGGLIASDTRSYPATPEPPRMEQDGEMYRFYMFPVASNVFVGPEGSVNTVISYRADGSFLSDVGGSDGAPVLVIDRFSWDGTYLDSYCLPDSALGMTRTLPDGRLVSRSYGSGALNVYRRLAP